MASDELSAQVDASTTVLGTGAPTIQPLENTELGRGTFAISTGQKIGDYQIQGVLGQGGMGTVYSAVHPLIGKKAAIKVISESLCRDPAAVKRFIQEARSVNKIGHPNIVDVFAFGELPDSRRYFIMEWLQGKSLAARLKEGNLPLEEALLILGQVADALEAAHAQGIVHRDLKPDNVFLVGVRGKRDMVKLLDFGIAKLAKNEGGAMESTRTGVMMGTPGYISPEQARGKDVDHRTDLYAFGVMAYLMLVGRMPFVADNAMDMVMHHLSTPPPEPASVWPEIPDALNELLLGLLAKEPGERPGLAKVREVLAEVHAETMVTQPADEARLSQLSTPSGFALNAPTPVPGQQEAQADGSDVATGMTPVQQAGRSRAPLVITFAVSAVIGGAVFAYVTTRPGDDATIAGDPVAAAPTLDTPKLEAPRTAPAVAGESVGTIVVDTNVDKARFELDGKIITSSVKSVSIPVRRAGQHKLVVSADGFKPDMRIVRVGDGATVNVEVSLEPIAAGKLETAVVKRRPPRPGNKVGARPKSEPRGAAASPSKRDPPPPPKKRRGEGYTIDPFAQ